MGRGKTRYTRSNDGYFRHGSLDCLSAALCPLLVRIIHGADLDVTKSETCRRAIL